LTRVDAALPIRPLIDDADLRVWRHDGKGDRLVVSFSGIGPDPETPPGYEFANTATGGGKDTVLFIADPNRTWLNAPGLIERIAGLVEDHARRIGAGRICALGHSMGGYAACVMAGFMRVDVAVALSPQVSVHPEIAGDDPRWPEHRDKLTAFRIRHLADHLPGTTQVYAVFGRHPREAPQRDRFPQGPNIHGYVLPRTHHNTAQRMKRAGVLDAAVQAAFDGRAFRVRRLLRRTLGARPMPQEPTS